MAYAAIVEMVAALDVDYDRLEELQAERGEWLAEDSITGKWENEREYDELREDAGECTNQDEARERVQEDALSVEVRSPWYTPGQRRRGTGIERVQNPPNVWRPGRSNHGELDEHGGAESRMA